MEEYKKGSLPDGEHIVTVIFDGHKPTKSWGGAIPKPALAIMKLAGRKRPRLTLLDMNSALGIKVLVTWQLNGDDLRTPKTTIDEKAIAAFVERVKGAHSGYIVKVWWGLR